MGGQTNGLSLCLKSPQVSSHVYVSTLVPTYCILFLPPSSVAKASPEVPRGTLHVEQEKTR